jgi:hypothetical protein
MGIVLSSTLGLLLVFGALLNAKPQTATAQTEGVYVVAYRAPNHVKFSSPEVFHGFAKDLISYLKSRDVNILEDPERGILQTDQLISVESLLNLTKNAGATYLFLATVERPATKWMKVTVQAYDLSGRLLWSEEADSGGMAMTGKGAPEKTLKLVQKKLDSRIDKPGLPKKSPETLSRH